MRMSTTRSLHVTDSTKIIHPTREEEAPNGFRAKMIVNHSRLEGNNIGYSFESDVLVERKKQRNVERKKSGRTKKERKTKRK